MIRDIMRHRYERTHGPHGLNSTHTPAGEPGHVETTYLTVGGAVVELRSQRFIRHTKVGLSGRLCGVPQESEYDGHIWVCLGCGATSERVTWQNANKHASECRAMPRRNTRVEAI